MANRYPTFETGRPHTDPVNFYAGGRLNRASWLRESSVYLNQALVQPDTKFVLLSNGNPLVHRNDRANRLALFSWKDVEATVMRTVRRVAPDATSVFGAEAYALRKKGDAEGKHWLRSTQGILAPALSLAFLGILEDDAQRPHMQTFPDCKERALAVPAGAPCFALSLSYRPPNVAQSEVLPGGELRDALVADDAPYDELNMRTVILTGALERNDAAVIAYARALIDWNERFTFCAACGSRQYSVWGSHKRACASVLAKLADGRPAFVEALYPAEPPATLCPSVQSVQNYSYPRSDPVIIVGILSADKEHILLGRQKTWPKGFYSCIAYVPALTQRVCGAGRIARGRRAPRSARRDRYPSRPRRIPQLAAVAVPRQPDLWRIRPREPSEQ